MKNTIITAITITLASLLPFSLRATGAGNNDDVLTDNYHTLTATVDNPTSAFLSLDGEAAEELGNIAVENAPSIMAGDIIDYASKYLGRPYRRGGKSPSGFDCSGFTSYVFSNFGINLSASSRTQFTQGESISFDQIQPGDLLFFPVSRGGKTVGHVAMAVDVADDGTVKFIHASSRSGICHNTYPDGGYYSSRFLGARRVLK